MPISINTRAFSQIPARPPQQEVLRIAGLREVHAAFDLFRTKESDFKRFQQEIVRVPAPPFGEQKRAEWLKQKFTELGLQDVEIDKIGNVLGLRKGTDPKAKLVALSAHIDTVFPAETQLNVHSEGNRIYGPGISDNGAGLTGLYAMAVALQAADVDHKAGILFVGNVGEEGEGDLRGARFLFTESKYKDRIGATIVLDGAGTDSVVTQALGSKRFEVTVKGPGGHSWSDYGTPNPIVILSRAIAQFSEANVPIDPKTSTNVGVITGGTSVNSIPESASARVDIRSSSTVEIDKLEKALRDAVNKALKEVQGTSRSRRNSVTAEVKSIGSRPAADLSQDARIVQVIRAVDAHLSLKSTARRASTDANIPMSLGKDAISIGAGGSGGGAHTVNEWYDPSGRDLGLKRIFLALLTLTGVAE
jgi:tripeptide aminopeptidase